MSQFTKNSNHSFKGLVFGCILKLIIAAVMTLVIQVSITFIATGMGTHEIGYTVLRGKADGSYETVYTHYNADGEDTELAKYQNDENYYRVAVRSELSSAVKNTVSVICSVFGIIFVVASVYPALWGAGDSDANAATFSGNAIDRNKGLKIGLCAEIPFAVSYLAMVVGKIYGSIHYTGSIYKLLNYYAVGYTNLFYVKTGNEINVSAWGLVALVLPLVIMPIVCTVCYKMGTKQVLLKEKILYSQKGEK